MKKNSKSIICILVIISFLSFNYNNLFNKDETKETYTINYIPDYVGKGYIELDNNEPNFDNVDTSTSFEEYDNLDNLDRATKAFANIGYDLMPTEKRKSIGMIKPTGWHTVKYDLIEGKYLYNRCHLIGYQLTGENANPNNLITCTRQMNTGVMLDYENKVAEYIRNTKNHVLYRVTPVYENDNLLATGVIMEALSVEDNGQGIKFKIFVYNVQDGIYINYKNGDSSLL